MTHRADHTEPTPKPRPKGTAEPRSEGGESAHDGWPKRAARGPQRAAQLPAGVVKAAERITPLFDRVLVRRMEGQGGLAGEYTLPAKFHLGVVVAAGPGTLADCGEHYVPSEVVVGDRVLFGAYAGLEIDVDGEAFVILNEEDVLAIVR